MRPPLTRPAWRAGSLPAVFSLVLFSATAAGPAQEKTATRPDDAKAAETTADKTGKDRPRSRRRGSGRRGRTRMLAIKVGTVHPVSGPDIQDGVILVQGGRIRAVGPAGKVPVPAGATVLEYPEGHAYPGLVDALSTAFADSSDIGFGGTNAGSDFKDALDPDHEPSHKVIESGITTAYVSNRSASTWRGLGVIIRPRKDRFARFRDRLHGGVQLRMTTGTRKSHALTRRKQLLAHGKEFDALEAYEKKLEEHEKALKEYKEKYEKYLDYYRKKNKKNKGARKKGAGGRAKKKSPEKESPEKEPSTRKEAPKKKTPNPGKETPKPRQETGKPETRKGTSKAGGKAAPAGAAKGSKAGARKDPKAPKKPKYPKPVKKVPAKEALRKVKEGKLPLRVEAHREDEIRAVLKLAREKEIPQVILEHASEAGAIAGELLEAGMPVVVTELLPGNAEGTYEERRDGSLPARLHETGVAVAIASGGGRAAAEHLALKAAWACGKGMPEEAAIRAITLTPAEILGVANLVGSLDRGKVADVLITSGPLLRSDTRVLRVLSQGQTQFDAEKAKAGKAKAGKAKAGKAKAGEDR